MLRLRILGLIFAASLAAPAQATVLTVAGGLQGAAIFANNNVDTSKSLGLGSLAGAAVKVKPLANVNPAKTENDSQLYAMIGLGIIGLALVRRKRYGRN